jgi:sec-independent protein translocase protein TatC
MAGPLHLPKRKMPSLPGFSTDDESHFDLFEEMAIAERDEVRSRLLKIGIGFVLAFIAGVYLTRPLMSLTYENLQVERTGLDPPALKFTDFFITGLDFAIAFSPLWMFYQVVAFVSPGLTRKEKRYAYGSLAFVAIAFLFGAALAFLVTIPRLLEFLENLNGDLCCYS